MTQERLYVAPFEVAPFYAGHPSLGSGLQLLEEELRVSKTPEHEIEFPSTRGLSTSGPPWFARHLPSVGIAAVVMDPASRIA